MAKPTRKRVHVGKDSVNEPKISKSVDKKKKLNVDEAASKPVKVDYKRLAIRSTLIFAMVLFLNYMHKDDLQVLVPQNKSVEKREYILECSSDYEEERKKFQDCAPKRCGRFISDVIVDPNEVMVLASLAERGLMLGGSLGGASILDLHSGALSKDSSFINIYKIDKSHKIITKEDLVIYSRVKNKIKAAVVNHFGLISETLYLTHPTFFSRLDATPPKIVHDEYWHPHVDKESYPSFHYTTLLYLTDYNIHFKGGRLVFMDKDANKTIEPRQGRLTAFTSGSENVHYVERVTEGTRFTVTVSFTCDPKYAIEDPKFPS